MKYYSEILNEFYDTEEKAFEAEHEYKDNGDMKSMSAPIIDSVSNLLDVLAENHNYIHKISNVRERLINRDGTGVHVEYAFELHLS